jgi:hypothetical protein
VNKRTGTCERCDEGWIYPNPTGSVRYPCDFCKTKLQGSLRETTLDQQAKAADLLVELRSMTAPEAVFALAEALRTVEREALERAAKVADAEAEKAQHYRDTATTRLDGYSASVQKLCCHAIARDIRSLNKSGDTL